ncbi:MAG: asparagine synthase (glutamine-hydrolyzing), partial [Bacteroidales bacterium]|nr:asparagine synthase (glutamine-hydrolyzing) [Bacteroidales bacterium]
MCGILAITSTKLTLTEPLIKKMLSSISHRGRDYQGFVHISQHNVWIGHARHSIIDLSPRAHQPMTNEDNTLFLSFNGEIYNFKSLKEDLLKHGHIFKSSTDAEVIIHGYEQWGVAVLQKLNGMFSFILYNSEKNEFFCARDRIGIKPFYYSVLPDTFMIASEIKPFLQLHSYNINYTSLCEYLTYRYVPSPNTIYNNIFKLPPAHYLIFNHRQIQIEPYWDVPINDSNCHNDLTNHIENLIIQSVQAHLISDVPVGIFLSGGIDSSTIALMTKKLGYKPTAFTIGFNNWALSEDKPATQTAKALGIDIKTKLLDPESLQNVYESAYFYDEPIADISIVPTFEISRWASQYVRTVLSGDGGDELFAGYTWHQKLINNRYIIRWKKNGIVNFYAQSMA